MDAQILLIFTLYCREVHGLINIKTAPDRRRLACYRHDGKGLNIVQFRGATQPTVEVIITDKIPPVSPQVHVEHAQYNFNNIIVDARGLPASLYKQTTVRSLGIIAASKAQEEVKEGEGPEEVEEDEEEEIDEEEEEEEEEEEGGERAEEDD